MPYVIFSGGYDRLQSNNHQQGKRINCFRQKIRIENNREQERSLPQLRINDQNTIRNIKVVTHKKENKTKRGGRK